MDGRPYFMDDIPVSKRDTRGKRGEAFYFRALDQLPSVRACVLSLGLRETMSAGFICHSGPAADEGYLFMDFHTPARVDPGARPQIFERGFVLWSPGDTRHYGNPDERWLHSWLNVSGFALDEAVAECGIQSGRVLGLDTSSISLKYLRAIHDEVQDQVTPDDQIIEGLIKIWLVELARAAGRRGATPPPRVTETRRYIQAHYAEPLELEALARRAALSVSQFSAVFKAHFGVPPIEYAHRLRLRQAAHLLRDDTLAVAEVASRVGYEDPLYFSRQFRKLMGQSPRQYRRNRNRKTG
jgi:AraC-like DNA-binding protein